jgi:hypothetical protein
MVSIFQFLLIFKDIRGKNNLYEIYGEGGLTMKCYVCAKQGVDEEAVAICIICGMGLCLGHAFKEELLVRDVIDWGFGEEKITYPRTLPRFICAECKLAMEQRKKGSQK